MSKLRSLDVLCKITKGDPFAHKRFWKAYEILQRREERLGGCKIVKQSDGAIRIFKKEQSSRIDHQLAVLMESGHYDTNALICFLRNGARMARPITWTIRAVPREMIPGEMDGHKSQIFGWEPMADNDYTNKWIAEITIASNIQSYVNALFFAYNDWGRWLSYTVIDNQRPPAWTVRAALCLAQKALRTRAIQEAHN